MNTSERRIAVVGPCASGKSTLVAQLRDRNVPARMPAQEHSYVPDMWRRLYRPRLLIYLDADNEALRRRRSNLTDVYLAHERDRLRHAREHAHLVVDTTELTAEEVYRQVQAWLEERGYTLRNT